MNDLKNPSLTNNSKFLRKNMTPQERHLWYDFLKNLPVNVNRQKVIGNYIVDFYISSSNLVIEIDGSQHFDEKGKNDDLIRDKYLSNCGLTVLRFSNYDINTSFDSVCQDILNHISI